MHCWHFSYRRSGKHTQEQGEQWGYSVQRGNKYIYNRQLSCVEYSPHNNIWNFLHNMICAILNTFFKVNFLYKTVSRVLLKQKYQHVSCCDMSQGCSQGYKSKTGPKRTQKGNIPKQRKYKHFTLLKL